MTKHRDVDYLPLTENSKTILPLSQEPRIEDILRKIEPVNHRNGQKRYIITGGPGAGKTSIINLIKQKGYLCMSEPATEIIESALAKGVSRPWQAEDYHITICQVLREKQVEAQNSPHPIVFFDRGHLDGMAYILFQKRKLYQYVVDHVQSSIDARFFEKKIFFIESLGFVVPSPARTEDLEESLQKAAVLEKNYKALGHDLIRIPPGTVEERVRRIFEHISLWNKKDKGS